MPALNEEKNVAAAVVNTLKAFRDFGIDGEVIVVDDGSTDRTGEIVDALAESHPAIRRLRHDTPRGIGASFWDGVDHAGGDLVCMLPGDNENDPWEILQYVGLLQHVDMVIPFVFNKEKRSLFRNALSFVYRFIINTTFLVYFNYTNGTVVYRTAILKGLEHRSTGFFFQTDIIIRAVKNGYLFAEVPYQLGLREKGVSKAVTFPSLVQVIGGYVRLVFDVYGGKGRSVPRRYAPGSQTAIRRENIPRRGSPAAEGGKERDIP